MPPRQKSRRGESNGDWEPSGTEDEYMNGLSGKKAANRVVADGVGERGDNSRSRQIRDGGPLQHRKKPDLGPWSEVVNETVQSMGAAHRAISALQDKFASHKDDIRDIVETRDKLTRLEETCIEKDEEIKRQGITIDTLTTMRSSTEQDMEHRKDMIEKEKKELDQERLKQDKRFTTAMAEEKAKLQNEFDKLKANENKSQDKRKKELEDEFAKLQRENNNTLTAVETKMKQLLMEVEEHKKKIEIQGKELKETTEQCDVLTRAKDSIRREKQDREQELQSMRDEFALNLISKDDFKQRFAAIQSHIERTSLKFSNDLEGKDPDKIHEELGANDSCFKSVPIDDSDDSHDLRIAHAERIISGAICEHIWKPLRSEFTLSHPDLDELLGKMSDELEKSHPGGRAINVWTALTMRALQSLSVQSLSSRDSESQIPHHPTGSGRAQSVISEVFAKLSPLVSSSQSNELRMELQELANEAIDIWDNAQTGEMKIVINQSLDRSQIGEWRFPPSDTTDIPSGTHNRIFTLFPRVMAQEVARPVEHKTGLPGSWPLESNEAPRRIETRIYPGKGLPEWSSLVVRGKKVQEEKNDFISKAMEDARKQLHSTAKRASGHGRRESMGSLISGPSSPSQKWSMEGVMKHSDN